MNSLRKIGRRTNTGPLELLIGTAIAVLATVLFLAHSYTLDTFEARRKWNSATAELKVRITVSHLWLEERLSGDRSIDVAHQIFANIDGAHAQCQALVNGGRTDVGEIERVPAGEARTAAAKTCHEIALLRSEAISRLRAGGKDVGTAPDQAYDASFTRILSLARKTQRLEERYVQERRMLLDRVNLATIAFLFALLAAIIVLIRRYQGRVRRLAKRGESILNSAGEGIYGLDRGGRTTFANPAAARLTGHTVEELVGHAQHELVHHTRVDGSAYPVAECPVWKSLEDGTVHQADGDVYWRKDGTSFPVEYTSTPIVEDGVVTGAVVVFKDITDRLEVERVKDEFTSVVSHELRTPLTSIRGSLGLLESGVLGPLPEKGQRMVEIAVENTDRLVRLINDILDIERIDSGQIDMRREPCEAAGLVERAAAELAPVAGEAQVKLEVQTELVELFADPDRVLQTLTNLISNAVKFSEPGASVRVSCAPGDGEVLFEVSDEGRGIPAKSLESIFERFQQVDASDSREKGGTGLGLAICRTIVDHHGGRIWVDSVPGRGSTFSFVLPAHTTNGSLPGARVNGGGPTILICDDDAAVVEVVGALLGQRGYRVIEASSGEQALERAIAERPDAILLDLLMPGTSGWETAAALSERPETSDIPIVILSVLSQAEADAPSVPIVDWVEKPLDESELFRALEAAVNAHSDPFKVLVVEDDPDLAHILTTMFERHNVQAFHAATGHQAIELSQRVLPDLLVLDLGLPEVDGFQVVDWLRRHERLSSVPMVIYTARDLDTADRERLSLGTTTLFLTKGRITPQDFEHRVMSLLDRLTQDHPQETSDEPEAHPLSR